MDAGLPQTFPFRDVFTEFLAEYVRCGSYWYVPKARVVNDDNIQVVRRMLKIIFDEFLDRVFDLEMQDQLRTRLVEEGLLEPRVEQAARQDRTALPRILKKLLDMLGLLWIKRDQEIVITDAGLDAIIADDPSHVIEKQIAKIQYPNPTIRGRYADDFSGLLPHLFLLQLLREVGYYLTFEEYELFVNLAQDQDDLGRIERYIDCWRDLTKDEQTVVVDRARSIPMSGDEAKTRHGRVGRSASYQRNVYTYPHYLDQNRRERRIICRSPGQVNRLVDEELAGVKTTTFESLEDWFAYFGDPKQQPSWYTYLSLAIERAATGEEARQLLREHHQQLEELAPDEVTQIEHRQIEKGIEAFYAEALGLLEDGLRLVDGGRQYSTPIGRIDLLCQSVEGEYVVVEIKAQQARDSAFGQVLRYVGWVHRNLQNARNNVRGIIVARSFPESARYSRIGLLKDDYRRFLKFKEHGLDLQTT
jgi:Holliday junction resolvase-like predicted endonuclease